MLALAVTVAARPEDGIAILKGRRLAAGGWRLGGWWLAAAGGEAPAVCPCVAPSRWLVAGQMDDPFHLQFCKPSRALLVIRHMLRQLLLPESLFPAIAVRSLSAAFGWPQARAESRSPVRTPVDERADVAVDAPAEERARSIALSTPTSASRRRRNRLLVLQLRIMSARAVVCAAGSLLVAALPARARDDDLWIGRPLMEHEVGQQVLDFGHAQLDVRGAGRSPFFAASAARASPRGTHGRRA